MNSAVLLGSAELFLIAAVTGEVRAADLLRPAVGVLAALNLVPLGLLASDLRPALSRLYPRRTRVAAVAAVVVVGTLVPLGLLAIGSGPAIASAVLLALGLAQFGVRFVIIHLPHRATES